MYISGERKALDALTLGLVASKRWRNGDVSCASILVLVVCVDVGRILEHAMFWEVLISETVEMLFDAW